MLRALTFGLACLAPACLAAETLTAARLIRPATILAPQDIAVIASDIPGALDGSEDIVGLETRTTLYPGHPIRPEHVGPAALIERNQLVVLTYRHGSLTIQADGRALSRGAVGERVRVMNLTSRTSVTGRVAPNGTILVGEGALP